MRRNNQRYNKRVKVHEDMNERVIFLEKSSNALLRSAAVQFNINKELQGKHNTVNDRLRKIYQQLKEITDSDNTAADDWHHRVMRVVADLESLTGKVDVMEDVLEDLV